MKSLTVGLCQMQSTDDIAFNQHTLLQQFKNRPAHIDLLCFPENCLFLRIDSLQPIPQPMVFFDGTESFFSDLQREVDAGSTAVLLGSVSFRERGREGGQAFNATLFFEPQKPWRVVYRKIHLFDVDVPGEKPQRESAVFAAGTTPEILDFRGWKIGLTICYDLRFAELYSMYAKAGCEVILVPSAFLPTTGAAHWHSLLRARAIESQAYVLAAAQSGEHRGLKGGVRHTYGHTLAVDPWGVIVAESFAAGPETLCIELDLGRIQSVRAAIPMAQHRKF